MGGQAVIDLPVLHAGQVAAYKVIQANRFTAVRAGRRFGKTALLNTIAANWALKHRLVGVFAPDYKRLSEVFIEIAATIAPAKESSSRVDGVIRTTTGGRIDFWTLNDLNAGRSRKYDIALVDEAAFAEAEMKDTWERAIKPTLLDYRGKAVAFSNTNGEDAENWFWQITNTPEPGFVDFHAPSRSNPFLPADELEALRKTTHPLVYQQEYEAGWVSWAGVAFFSIDKLLQNGKPVAYPTHCDGVFAVIDTAVKTGKEHDGTAVTYWARNQVTGIPMVCLDWDAVQIEGALLETWLPTVFERLKELAIKCKSRNGSLGAFIEDKASGSILLQQALRRKWPAHSIDSKLTAVGKDERAISVSGYVFSDKVKLSDYAFEKTANYKGVVRNHMLTQVTGFRIADKDAATREDDLLDSFCYGIAIGIGNKEGY